MSVQVYGDRIRSARILRNMKAIDLAAALGWSPSRQTLAEQSETVNLDSSAVRTLTDQLRFPEAFFMMRPSPVLMPRDLLFRAPKSISKRETGYLAEFARVSGDVLTWLDTYHRLPPVKLPLLPSGLPVAEAARQVRAAMCVPLDQPIGNLTFQLERAGVPVVARHSAWTGLPEKHLGYSTRVGDHRERPVTIIRVHNSWERTRWTVGHEVAHHVLHSAELPADAENQANQFASELLAPASVIRDELPKLVTLAGLTEIKLRWGISLGALIIHLAWNGLINDERMVILRKQLYKRFNPETGHSWGREEPGADARAPERPSLIVTWMQRCLGGTSPNLISALSGNLWPPDVIAMITDYQQRESAASPSQRRGKKGNQEEVIDLSAWRRRA